MAELKVRLTFEQELLGTKVVDRDLYTAFVGKDAPEGAVAEELEHLPEHDENGEDELDPVVTSFLRSEDGEPMPVSYTHLTLPTILLV